MVEAKATARELTQRIDAEASRVTKSVGINKTVAMSREAQLRLALDEQRAKIMKLKAQRDEAAVLLRDVENAQRGYDTLQSRVYQSNLETKSTQTNISVLKEATAPIKHSSPKLIINIPIAVFMGLMLGMGCALLLELRDRRVRTDEDVINELDTLIIGKIPLQLAAPSSKPGMKLLPGKSKPAPKLAAPAA